MTITLRSAVKVTGLRKSIGDKVILDGIDLDIAEGTTFSLLGPNGAGKTTAVQILSTLLRVDAGEVHIAGFDIASEPDAVRAAIGVTGQVSAVDNLLTGEENLMLMANLHHLDRREGLVVAERANCSTSSTSSVRLGRWSRPTREACGAGWTSP